MNYINKISGPLLDRIDIYVEMLNVISILSPEVAVESENSDSIRGRVISARNLQSDRYKNLNIRCNAEINGEMLNQFAQPNQGGLELLKYALKGNYLSNRGYTRVLKVARTIADLENSEKIMREHIAETLSYRIHFKRFM